MERLQNSTAQGTGSTEPELPRGIDSSVMQDHPCAGSQTKVPVPKPSKRTQLKKEGDKGKKHSGITQIFESEGNVILHNEKKLI